MRIDALLSVPDLRAAEREPDQNAVTVDRQGAHLPDVDTRDAHLVAGVDAAGILELRVVARGSRKALARL